MINQSIAIIGGGVTGLTAAYRLAKLGYSVTVFEAEPALGGLAGSFEIQGRPLEQYYHHVFQSDKDFISLLGDLGVKDKLRFSKPPNAMYFNNQLIPLSNPFDILKFPYLGAFDKALVTYNLAYLTQRDWRHFPKQTAAEWLSFYMGEKAYQTLWEPLLKGKFGAYADKIALSWFWARFATRTIALGYFEDGFQSFINELARQIISFHGKIKMREPVTKVKKTRQGFQVITPKSVYQFQRVLFTTAPSIYRQIIDSSCTAFPQPQTSQDYLAAQCLILSLNNRLTPYYWININDAASPFTVLVEHTNFQSPNKYHNQTIIYLGKYVDSNDKVYTMSKNELLIKYLPWLKKINPTFNDQWIKDFSLFRHRYSQPIVDLSYEQKIPPLTSPEKGIYLASMAQIFPYDRGMNFSVALADQAASIIDKDIHD